MGGVLARGFGGSMDRVFCVSLLDSWTKKFAYELVRSQWISWGLEKCSRCQQPMSSGISLGTGKTNKACPWATMVWVSQLRIYLPI